MALRNVYGEPHAPLVYLYWEPRNADEVAACQEHRKELVHLDPLLNDDHTTFKAWTYGALLRGKRM